MIGWIVSHSRKVDHEMILEWGKRSNGVLCGLEHLDDQGGLISHDVYWVDKGLLQAPFCSCPYVGCKANRRHVAASVLASLQPNGCKSATTGNADFRFGTAHTVVLWSAQSLIFLLVQSTDPRLSHVADASSHTAPV